MSPFSKVEMSPFGILLIKKIPEVIDHGRSHNNVQKGTKSSRNY